MSTPTTYPYSMTLRLTNQMESDLESLAFNRGLAKAEFLRLLIRQAIAQAHRDRSAGRNSKLESGGL
jgi:hypothetical protein